MELSNQTKREVHEENIRRLEVLLYDAQRNKLVAEKCAMAGALDNAIKVIPQIEKQLEVWKELLALVPPEEPATPNAEESV